VSGGEIGTVGEEQRERRWEAAPAVAVVIGLQLLLALVSKEHDWKLWHFEWWVWLIGIGPELVLTIALAWDPALQFLERLGGHRRNIAVALVAVISVDNAFALVALLASLIKGSETSGGQLLLKAATIWGTNVIAFGLWFWLYDRGGPKLRAEYPDSKPDFLFPQIDNPRIATPGWHPRLVDYIYVSFTNSIAFSPTDVLPLSRWAKMLMLAESFISAVTILLVAARAVNIFK
jgi:hypothetical protein